MTRKPTHAQLVRWQNEFVAALPRMQRVIRFRLRHLSEDRREEDSAEAIGIAWQNYRNLRMQGRDPAPYIGKIAEYAARSVNSGRKLTGLGRIHDVMSRVAQHEHGHDVESIPLSGEDPVNPAVLNALRDHREPSPADQAILNADYEAWLDTLDSRRRKVAQELAGERTNTEVGDLNGVSRGRICQHREELRRSWAERFQEPEVLARGR